MKTESWRDTSIPMFIAALFTGAMEWKQGPSVDKWVNELWYVHKMKYYSAFKRLRIMTHVMKWIYHENNRLNEINQLQKDKQLCIKLDMRYPGQSNWWRQRVVPWNSDGVESQM